MHRAAVVLVSALALLASRSDANGLTQIGMPLADGPDPYGPAVAKTVYSIMEYTRWPDDRARLTLCAVGPSEYLDNLAPTTLADGRKVAVRRLAREALLGANCSAVYIGRLAFADQRAIANSVRGQAVLTIAESDPACRSRAMVCLLFEADALSFRFNIDAVSRSQVRIDSRVLRMGLGGGTA